MYGNEFLKKEFSSELFVIIIIISSSIIIIIIINLCDSVATMTRNLCTEYLDSHTIEPLLANRLILFDKGAGQVRPIGVGEVVGCSQWCGT